MKELGTELSAVPWPAAIAASFVSIFANVVRSYRWKIGIESFTKISFKNVLSAFFVGVFGLNVIPARIGEYLRIFVLGKNSSLSQSSLLATVVFERVVDGLAILTIFALAVMFRPVTGTHNFLDLVRKEFLLVIPLIFVVSLGILYAGWRRPQSALALLEPLSRRLGKFGTKLPGVAERFVKGLVIFSDVGRLALYLLWSFAAWLTVALFLYLNFLVLDIPLGFSEAVVVLVATVVGAMIPAAPGFVGTYHAFCKAALVSFGVDEARALTFAVVTHALPYLLGTTIGFLCVLRENVRWTDLTSDRRK